MNASVGTNRGLMEGTMTGGVINIVNSINGVTESTMREEIRESTSTFANETDTDEH